MIQDVQKQLASKKSKYIIGRIKKRLFEIYDDKITKKFVGDIKAHNLFLSMDI